MVIGGGIGGDGTDFNFEVQGDLSRRDRARSSDPRANPRDPSRRAGREINPPPEAHAGGWLGCMAGTIEIVGDIVEATAEPKESWEALRE